MNTFLSYRERILFTSSGRVSASFQHPFAQGIPSTSYTCKKSTVVQDTNKDPIFLIRTLMRRVQLLYAFWNADGLFPPHRLPRFWFNKLGRSICATATLRRKLHIPQGMEFELTNSFISQSMSISIPKISVPATKSLLALLPPEVTSQDAST